MLLLLLQLLLVLLLLLLLYLPPLPAHAELLLYTRNMFGGCRWHARDKRTCPSRRPRRERDDAAATVATTACSNKP